MFTFATMLDVGLRKNMKKLKDCILGRVFCSVLCLSTGVMPIYADHEIVDRKVTSIKGKVITVDDGLPVIGASILIEGTKIGTVTDVDGNFYIANIPVDAKRIKVSYLGLKSQNVAVQPELLVKMVNDDAQLDEVMVVAYGTAKKSTFTGSASVIKTDKLDDRPVTEVSSALLGSAPGISVSSSSGMPGTSSTIRIRGVGSFSASSSPLIVLDGIPYEGSLSNLNPTDIASMSVLKDAASTALYGARAANGVIVISTKKGKSGKAQVNFKFNQGVTMRQSSDYEKLGVDQYCEIYWENLRNRYLKDGMSSASAAESASANLMDVLEYNPFTNVDKSSVVGVDGKFNTAAQMAWGDDTDWEDAIQRAGHRTDASVSVTGGNDKNDYYFSLGAISEDGYIIGSSLKRYTFKTNVNSQVTSWLKLGMITGGNISAVDGQQNTTRNNLSNPFLFTRYVSPLYPIHMHDATTGNLIYDNNGDALYDFGVGYNKDGMSVPNRSYCSTVNPVIELAERKDGYTRKMFDVKGYAEVSFLKYFTFTLNGSVNSSAYLGSSSSKKYEEKGNVGTATRTNSFTTTTNFNELLDYMRKFGSHHLDVLIGHENYRYEYNYLTASMKGEIMSGNSELGNYTELNSTPLSYTTKYRTEGYFMRTNYDYDDLYYVSLSFRRDGSSRFYKESRWGNFGSVGAGWSISRSLFADTRWLDNLKLRLSYGEVGNDNVGGYFPWVASYAPSNNATEAGYVQSSMGNKDLKWEVSRNFDVAVEFGFCNRLSGTLEFFTRKSSNLLFEIPLSPSTGFDSQDRNSGSMKNYGVEFQASLKILDASKWKWGIDFNGTYLKNKITSLPVDPFIDSNVFRIEEGYSRYEFYLKDWRGVDPATGNCIYAPIEGAKNIVTVDGEEYTTSLSEAAYCYGGSGLPSFTGGFSTSLSYGNLSLTATLYYQLGGKAYDTAYSNLMTPNQRSYNNLSVDILKRWQKAGDITKVPRLSDGSDATDLIGENSTRWLVSSDMLELANVVLSYQLPKSFLRSFGISSLRVYASGENLLQITKRKGLFPRQNTSGYTNNGDTFAPARVFTAGVNLSF